MEKIKSIVKSVTAPKEWNGELQIGFTLEDNSSKWYNISDNAEALDRLRETIIKSGNEIEFDYDPITKQIEGLGMISEAKEKPKKDGNWADDIVDFETLLTKAHEKSKGKFSIKTECLNVDAEKNYALFKATVVTNTGETFEAHGDTTNINLTSPTIKPHFIRMAETRAICRALRWFTNNGCAEEEK